MAKLDVSKCNKRFGKNKYEIRNIDGGAQEVVIRGGDVRDVLVPLDVRAVDGADNECEISFSSDTPIMRYGEAEILSHEDGDYSFEPLENVGGILRNHDPDQLVGSPIRGTIRIEMKDGAKRGRMRVRFGSTKCAKNCKVEVMEDMSMRGVSVGYSVKRWIYLENENVKYKSFAGPAWVGIWEAREASFTPVPLDATVGANRSAHKTAGTPAEDEEIHMDPKEEAAKREADEVARKQKEDADRRAAEESARASSAKENENKTTLTHADVEAKLKAERAREREIRLICKRSGLEDKADEFIDSDKSVNDVRALAFAHVCDNSAVGGDITVTRDGADSVRAAASDGLLLRGGMTVAKPAPGADEFRGMTLMRMAEEFIRRSGRRVPTDAREIAGMALGLRGSEAIVGSTADFPLLLANTANKSLIEGYATAPVSFPFWASVGSLNDFKATSRVKFGEIGKLKLVQENGKYTDSAIKETRETIQLGTYARRWTMTRQGIINDDLAGFTRVPFSMGMQARFLPNELAIAVLTTNAAMSDGAALFSAAHSNTSSETDRRLDTVAHAQAAAVYLYGLFAAKQTMQHANDADGARYLNIRPKVWLVSMTDELIARQAVVSAGDATASVNSGIVNPVAALSLQVIPDQAIKQNSTDYTHFMFADPRLAPVVEVAFLQGNQQPYMERMEQTDADGVIYLVRLDCGAAAVDHVGAVREVGTD